MKDMNIITVSRQFGSGGRELGKRLADCLGYDYYDKEIIEAGFRQLLHLTTTYKTLTSRIVAAFFVPF